MMAYTLKTFLTRPKRKVWLCLFIFPYEDTEKSIYEALNTKYKSKPTMISENEYYSTDFKHILKTNIENVLAKGVTGMI